MAGPNAVSAQASLMAPGHRLGCRWKSSVKKSRVVLHAEDQGSAAFNSKRAIWAHVL